MSTLANWTPHLFMFVAVVMLLARSHCVASFKTGVTFVNAAGDLQITQILTPMNFSGASQTCQSLGGSLMGFRNLADITGGLYNDQLVNSGFANVMYIGLEVVIPAANGNTAALPRAMPPPASDWGEGSGSAAILKASAFVWDDGDDPSYISQQQDAMSLQNCPAGKFAGTGLTCCGTVYNVGGAAYNFDVPLIVYTLCTNKFSFVCEAPTSAQLGAPPAPPKASPSPAPAKNASPPKKVTHSPPLGKASPPNKAAPPPKKAAPPPKKTASPKRAPPPKKLLAPPPKA